MRFFHGSTMISAHLSRELAEDLVAAEPSPSPRVKGARSIELDYARRGKNVVFTAATGALAISVIAEPQSRQILRLTCERAVTIDALARSLGCSVERVQRQLSLIHI